MVKGDMAITMGSEEVVPKGDTPDAGKTIKRRYTNIWTNKMIPGADCPACK
jgi:hypothetical protein